MKKDKQQNGCKCNKPYVWTNDQSDTHAEREDWRNKKQGDMMFRRLEILIYPTKEGQKNAYENWQ